MADRTKPAEPSERLADVTSGVGGLRHRIRYRFDNLLARGTWPVLVWLGAITFGAILLSALLLALFRVTLSGSEDGSWLEDFWQSLLRVLDTGTMAADVGWGRRLLALAITIFGVLVAGTLIGVIASGVEQRIDRMRKGRSVVIESDHLVVLGASERIPVLLQQFVLADAARSNNAVVVLADRDPTELSDAVGRVVDDTLGSRLVFRSGDPTSTSDLELVRLDRARAIVVLADADGQDSRAVKTVLAIGARLDGFDRVPIVVELHDTATAQSLVEACGSAIHPIIAAQAAARVASFALRQRGLSQVVGELLDYRGSDVHITDQDDLVGVPFAAVLGRYAKARPIGIVRSDGRIELNPGPEARLEGGDRLVVVADDAERLELAQPGDREPLDRPRRPLDVDVDMTSDDQHLLVIGWNALGVQLLAYWAMITSAASTVEIAYDTALIDPEELELPPMDVARVIVTPIHKAAGTTSGFRRRADDEPPLTTVVMLAYADHLSVADADSRTLLDLLVLRRRLAEMPGQQPRVVVEILDVDDLPLARVSGADDYLVSQATGSQFIAQLAEQPERRAVYLQLYAVDGPSIHLVPADRLQLVGEHTTAEVVAATYDAGFVAIGWRRANARGGELTLNPRLDATVRLEPDDEVVVIG